MAEAKRDPTACPHVESPQEPVLLFGCPLAEVEAKATEWAEGSRDSIGRKLRIDGLCLLAGVVSAPEDMTDPQWDAMKRDAIEWLGQDGRLVSVVEHVDESHRHFHFYKVAAPGERFETLHPGRAAALAAKASGALKGDQNKAYKEAMRGLQDDFYDKVGARHGLTRLGPAKRRLTRSGWQAEKAASQALAKTMAKSEGLIAKADAIEALAADYIKAAKAAKAEALASAEQAKAEADKASAQAARWEDAKKANALTVARGLKQKAAMEQIAERIKGEREVIDAWKVKGGRLGAFVGALAGRAVDAFTGVLKSRKEKEQAEAAKLHAARRAAAAARSLAEEEADRANRMEFGRRAEAEAARKQLRVVEAEKRQVEQQLAKVTAKAPSQAQKGPRMGP